MRSYEKSPDLLSAHVLVQPIGAPSVDPPMTGRPTLPVRIKVYDFDVYAAVILVSHFIAISQL